MLTLTYSIYVYVFVKRYTSMYEFARIWMYRRVMIYSNVWEPYGKLYRGVSQSGDVAYRIFFSRSNFAQYSSHDFSRSSLYVEIITSSFLSVIISFISTWQAGALDTTTITYLPWEGRSRWCSLEWRWVRLHPARLLSKHCGWQANKAISYIKNNTLDEQGTHEVRVVLPSNPSLQKKQKLENKFEER